MMRMVIHFLSLYLIRVEFTEHKHPFTCHAYAPGRCWFLNSFTEAVWTILNLQK